MILALKLPRPDFALTIFLAAAGILCTFLMTARTFRTPLTHAPIAAAASLALLMLLGWGDINAYFRPRKAPSDSTRIVHNQIAAAIPKNVPIYTTRTLLSGKGNDYFNIQFYLPSIPTAIDDLSDIPPTRHVVLIIGWEEWNDMSKALPSPVRLTDLHADNGPPNLFALEITNFSGVATQPATRQSATSARPASSP